MRHVSVIVVALMLATGAAAGVRPIDPGGRPTSDTVEVTQSAALFVGIREFPYDSSLTDVKYAVDDAVDLAHVFAMQGRSRLVDPARVVLALSGDPEKPESQRKLDALLTAGALVKAAGSSDIIAILEEQSSVVGRNGLLIVAFATHGISSDGVQYLLTASSLLRHRETSISEAKIREIVSGARVARALILLDACRRRLTSDTREGEPDPRSAAALLRDMAAVEGQVVLSAAAVGDYAYDDDRRRNGVFSAAVVDGVLCGAATDRRGYVTVDTLFAFVEEQVLSWIQKHRDPRAPAGYANAM